jgi:hypothetical protein
MARGAQPHGGAPEAAAAPWESLRVVLLLNIQRNPEGSAECRLHRCLKRVSWTEVRSSPVNGCPISAQLKEHINTELRVSSYGSG